MSVWVVAVRALWADLGADEVYKALTDVEL